MDGHAQSHRDFFPSTHWSMLEGVRQADESTAGKALGRLLEHYQNPLKLYIARKFQTSEEDTADLFQGFVERVVMQNQLFQKARRAEGKRFRSYVIGALHHFVISEFRKSQALSRMPTGGLRWIEGLEGKDEPAIPDDSGAFDVVWARAVLQRAFDQMKAECESNGRNQIWGVFEQRILDPILDGVAPMAYEDLVAQFGWATPAEAQNALTTAKRMFARTLRGVVAEYVADPKDVEAELAALQAILAHSNGST